MRWNVCGDVEGVSVPSVTVACVWVSWSLFEGVATPLGFKFPSPGKSSHRDGATTGESERDTSPPVHLHSYL